MSTGRVLKAGTAALFLLLAVGFAVPSVKADRYRTRIQSALERGLGRKVSIGEVRLNLLTGPGFTLHDVTVEEDPALGIEPMAYVDRVIATPRLLSLLTGHLNFSSLRLEDAHLNLARADLPGGEYRWNFEPLLRPALIAAFPNITIHGARINFKAANVKSVVYLLDSDLFIEPPAGTREPWRFRFEGKPARTDRPARGSGLIRVKGSWKPGMLDANLQLERSELGDLIAILRGEDAGLHGLISGSARFSGPLERVQIEGRLSVEELHGWEQNSPKGESWPLEMRGRWNSPAQQLELDLNVAGKTSPLSVHYLVSQYLTQPRWGASVQLTAFPAAPLVPLSRHLGLPLSPGFQMTGTLDGVLGYSVAGGYGGQARLTRATVNTLRIAEAQVVLAGGVARLEPARVIDGENQQAVLEGAYTLASGTGTFRISAANLDVATLAQQLPVNSIPVLSVAHSGRWSGSLEWSKSGWAGDMALVNLEIPSPALAEPITIESALCHIGEGSVSIQKLRAHAGVIEFTGEYRYQPEAAHPHRFRLVAGQVDAAALEKLLLPTLHRGRGLLDLPFRTRALPAWLAQWHAEGTLQVAALENGLRPLPNLRTRFQWDAARVQLTEIASSNLTGRAAIDLRAPDPAYELSARLRNQDWKGGHITVDTAATLHGTGPDLLQTLQATGQFTAVEAEDSVDRLTGRYTLSWRNLTPRLSLEALHLQSSADLYTGTGALQEDGTVLLQLSAPNKQAHLSGPLTENGPLRWTP